MDYFTIYSSPVGKLFVTGRDDVVTGLIRIEGAESAGAGMRRDERALVATVRQLDRYFAGELTEFEIPLHLSGTPFQEKVWAGLRAIPYGRTVSYAELAAAIGAPKAVRAVGNANGRNPIAIIVPCHRVIASGGGIGGYSGGLDMKTTLLDLEQQTLKALALRE